MENSPLDAMHLSCWTRYTTFSLIICMMLASCSVPDGPDPQTSSAEASPEIVNNPAASPITLSGPGQLLPVTATAEMKAQIFELEVARTSQEQALGLMFRSALPDNRGMLFPFVPPRRTRFWMKNVPVPLDMVFIRNGAVVAIAPQVPPCQSDPCPSYGPSDQIIDYVLELRSGRAAEIGLQPGDEVAIRASDPAALPEDSLEAPSR